MGACIGQMRHAAIQTEMQAGEHLFHPEHQIIIERWDVPVFFRAEPLQPSLARMDNNPGHARTLNHR